MATSDGYGRRLGQRMRVGSAPSIITRAVRNAEMAVTEIRCDHPVPGFSHTGEREDAFLISPQFRKYRRLELWEDGRQLPVSVLRAGEMLIFDLKRDPVALLDKPYHALMFYLPRAALNSIADDADATRIGDLNYKPGQAINDATISNLAGAILPALSRPEQANRLFVDHVMLAVAAHVAHTYGDMRLVVSRRPQGGLAPWQLRRATEILSSNLGGVPLKELAQECRLSVSHFSRAFRRTVGVAPHNWLLMRRIELAREKLGDNRLSLSEVAMASGFADQSHLTRVFTRMVGVSPGAWRRALGQADRCR
jgi:AraC family transcriptional regulator